MELEQEVRDTVKHLVDLVYPEEPNMLVMDASTIASIVGADGRPGMVAINSVQDNPVIRVGLAVTELVAAVIAIIDRMTDIPYPTTNEEDDDGTD